MNEKYISWLQDHKKAATARYKELSALDDRELASGGESSAYYEQAHQMFGYVAALEKCLKEAKATSGPKKRKARSN